MLLKRFRLKNQEKIEDKNIRATIGRRRMQIKRELFPTPEKKTLLTRIKQIVIRKVIVEKLSMITIEQKALV